MSYFETIYADDLPGRAKNVYRYLHDRADRQGRCYPAIPTIARELGISRSTVKRALEDLKASRYITVEQRWRQSGGKSSLLFTLVK